MLGWTVVPRVGFDAFGVSPHGIGIAIGVFAGAWLMARQARKIGLDEDHVWNSSAWGVVGAIVGARLAFLAGHLDLYESVGEMLRIWEGGISLVGGLLGAFVAAFIYARMKDLPFFLLGDLAAKGLALGIALGRSGDLLIGDHLGKPTSFFLGWQYQGGHLISPPPCTNDGQPVYPTIDGCIEPGLVVHQTAIYDMFWSLAILGILVAVSRKPRNRGFLFLTWAGLYALGRVVTDFLRVDKSYLDSVLEPIGLPGLTGSQITSLVALAVIAFLLIRYRGAPPFAQSKAYPVAPSPGVAAEDDTAVGVMMPDSEPPQELGSDADETPPETEAERES